MLKLKYCLMPILLLIVTSSLTIHAQILEKQVDGLILKDFKDPNGTGGVFMVAHHGKIVYQKGFGKANLELNVNMAPENVFQLGSMTKQFTAVAVLMLVEQGKLKLSDPISTYLPEYPQGNKITIHHLLTHTSGIMDFTKMKSLSQIAQKEMPAKDLVDFFKNEPMEFSPGEKFVYNNSGYVLLGYLIELVSGERYEDFIRTHIFEKVGMDQSTYASDRKIILKRAYGYQKKEEGYVNKTMINFSIPFSSGSLMSTAGDMLKWQNALKTNKLVGAKELDKAFSNYKLNNGEVFSYGYGWHIKDINGVQTREHGGSIFGFKTMGVYIPSEDIYVIGLTNCDCISPTKLTGEIAKIALNLLSKKTAKK